MIKKMFSWLNMRIGAKFNRFQRNHLKKRLRKQAIDTNISIISQNCIGGVMYHELGLKFCSPTINIYIEAEDFIKFCENMQHYLSIEAKSLRFVKERSYPVGYLDDIKIYFVHYTSEEEAIKKWEERRKRINYKKICIVMTDRDGFNKEILHRFSSLKYKKILFASRNYSNKDVIFMPCFKRQQCVGGLTAYCNVFGKRYYRKYFDIIKWLTEWSNETV